MCTVLQHPETGLTACEPEMQIRIKFVEASTVVSAAEIDLLEAILPDIIAAMAEATATSESERKAESCM